MINKDKQADDTAQFERVAGLCASELFDDEIDAALSELSGDDWAVIDSIDMKSFVEETLFEHKSERMKKMPGMKRRMRWAAIAACAVFILLVLYFSPIPFMETVRAEVMELLFE